MGGKKGAAARERGSEGSGGFDSMREAYEQVGAAGYYGEHGRSYRNPHEPLLRQALWLGLGALERKGLVDASSRPLRVLDLACGSGEVSLALRDWAAQRPERCEPELVACDPYTHEAFEERTGDACERWSFEDVAAGVLDEQPPFDLVVAAFALHLMEPSYFKPAMDALARACRVLIVATPHKRPHVSQSEGWEEVPPEILHERVRVRAYTSLRREPPEPAVLERASAAAAAAAAREAERAAAEAAARAESDEESSGGSEDEDEEDGEIDEEALIEELMEEISAMNIGQLRAQLAERGLDKSGKKGELAERLLAARVEEAKEGLDDDDDEDDDEKEEDGGEEDGEEARRREEEARAAAARAEEAKRKAKAEEARRVAAEKARAEKQAAREAKAAARVMPEKHRTDDRKNPLALTTNQSTEASTLAAVRVELLKAQEKASRLAAASAAEEARAAEAAARAERLVAIHAAMQSAEEEERQSKLDDAFSTAENAGIPLAELEAIDSKVEAGDMSIETALQELQALCGTA